MCLISGWLMGRVAYLSQVHHGPGVFGGFQKKRGYYHRVDMCFISGWLTGMGGISVTSTAWTWGLWRLPEKKRILSPGWRLLYLRLINGMVGISVTSTTWTWCLWRLPVKRILSLCWHSLNPQVDWLDGRNICREYCMDLASLKAPSKEDIIIVLTCT